MKKINLDIDTTNKLITADEGGNVHNGGNLCTEESDKLKWQGKYSGGGEFVVTFKDANTGALKVWPFASPAPAGNELYIAANGQKEVTTLPGSWKYYVEYKGATNFSPLDPMIIVRNSNLVSDFLPLVITFALGAVAGGVFGAQLVRRRRA